MKTVTKVVSAVVLATAVGALALVSLRTGPAPEVRISPSARAIGQRTSVVVTAVTGGRGLAGLRVEVEQNGHTTVVQRVAGKPLPPWTLQGARPPRQEVRAEVGRSAVPDLAPGQAVVRVVAERAPTWLLHPAPVVSELKLPVRLAPPVLTLVSPPLSVAQGGSGAVVYQVAGEAVRDGVRAGDWFFPGRPLPGSATSARFALFGVPWDLADRNAIRLIAEDDAGNVAERAFVERCLPKPPRKDRIELQDDFLSRVVPEIVAQTPDLPDRGSLLDNYLQINRELRRRNALELVELSRRSEAGFLWSQPFLPLQHAQVMSSFADQRSYFYGGREVDQQTHLGFDLAVTAHTPVPAANRGLVRLARYFGIYGNTVVVDHGFGLMTLYSHLSSIDVAEGQAVERGAVLGRTGRTGLAGGDHLHFTTLIGGLPVRPTEWWDARWVREHVAAPLAPAVTLAGLPASR